MDLLVFIVLAWLLLLLAGAVVIVIRTGPHGYRPRRTYRPPQAPRGGTGAVRERKG